jgi:hypothetical protein
MQLLSVSTRERLMIIFVLGSLVTAMLGMLSSNVRVANITAYPDQIAKIVEARSALVEGQMPLRVAPAENLGWGYPLFQFNSPTSYTAAALIYKFISPLNPYIAYKATLWCGLLLGAVFMFRLSNWLFASRVAALLASCVYLSAPYFIIVINHAAEFNEALALGILPVVLYYTLRLFYSPASLMTFLPVAICWYLLLTVHLITFVFTSLMVALLLLFAVLKQPRLIMNLLRTSTAYGFGLLLGLWFLAPQMVLHNDLNQLLFASSGDIAAMHPLFANLVSPVQNISAQLVTAAGVVETGLQQLHPNLGLPVLFGFVVAGYAFLNRARLGNVRADFWLGPLLVTFVIAFLLAWSPVNFWRGGLQYFTMGNYYWSMLGQLVWLGALLFGWSLCWFFPNKLNARHAVLGVFILLLSTSAWLAIPEKNQVNLNLRFILNKPVEINQATYLINIKNAMNKINFIDTLSIKVGDNSKLLINHAYPLPLSVFAGHPHSTLLLQGAWPTKSNLPQISVYLNDNLISIQKPQPGNFRWEIPAGLAAQKNKAPLMLTLRAQGPKDYAINFENISATGYLDPAITQSVTTTEKMCHREGSVTVCELQAGANIKLIELPVIYYPGMLRVTRNGKNIPYVGVLFRNYLIAGVVPGAGKNIFRVEFTGLSWANSISGASWGIWIILLVYLGLKRAETVFRSPRSRNPL